jgi:hypothetical protein
MGDQDSLRFTVVATDHTDVQMRDLFFYLDVVNYNYVLKARTKEITYNTEKL